LENAPPGRFGDRERSETLEKASRSSPKSPERSSTTMQDRRRPRLRNDSFGKALWPLARVQNFPREQSEPETSIGQAGGDRDQIV